MLEQIKPLVRLGFSVIWLKPKSKMPLENGWQKLPTKSYADLKKTHKETFNVGVRPGTPSKLVDGNYLAILDCDMKSTEKAHVKELHKALDVLVPEWREWPKVISGRNKNSMHLYCKTLDAPPRMQLVESSHKVKAYMPSKAATSKDREILTDEEISEGYRLARAWEISFYGTGGQIVLPPSIHPDSGREYTWENEITSIEDLQVFEVPKTKKVKLSAPQKGSKFKIVEYDIMDLLESGVADEFVDLIVHGKGMDRYNEDRSAAIYGVLNALIHAQVPEDLILTIMTDRENFISEKPLERGGGKRFNAMRWLIRQIQKVKADHEQRDGFDPVEFVDVKELSEEEIEAQQEGLYNWTDRLEKNQYGQIKNTSFNRKTILDNCLLPETLCWNEFAQTIEYRYDPPWKQPLEATFVNTEMRGEHLTRMRVWFSKHWGIDPSEDEIFKMVNMYSRDFSFHPIREYLKELKWDKKPRLDRWLITYMGASRAPSKYIEAVGRRALLAAVYRIMRPGYKFDEMLVLEGEQGTGKSTALNILGGKWYGAPQIDPANKDTIANLHNLWIVEVEEMAPTYKSEVNALKAFFSKTEDRARLAYEKKAETFPRQCIFIGSTNDEDYLQDATGNRRYWPVWTNEIDNDGLRVDRDQIWAEAYHYYKKKAVTHLETAELKELAKAQQRKRLNEDPWESKILEYLEGKKRTQLLDIWKVVMGYDGFEESVGRFTMSDQKRIAKVLKANGWRKGRARIGNDGGATTRIKCWLPKKERTP